MRTRRFDTRTYVNPKGDLCLNCFVLISADWDRQGPWFVLRWVCQKFTNWMASRAHGKSKIVNVPLISSQHISHIKAPSCISIDINYQHHTAATRSLQFYRIRTAKIFSSSCSLPARRENRKEFCTQLGGRKFWVLKTCLLLIYWRFLTDKYSSRYMTHAKYSTKAVFDLKDDDIYWCTADVGWITGHT